MSTAPMNTSALAVERTDDTPLPLAILRGLGSLKITVTMFALGIFIVLFGTLAQDELDLTAVKREYFTCWIARVPLDVMFPVTLVPHEAPYFGGLGFYFPGGATIGLILLVNLIAAKVTRFKIQSKGTRFLSGLILSLFGAALVVAVIIGGHAANGLQGRPPIAYDTLWGMLKGGCVAITLVGIGYTIMGAMPKLARVFSGIASVVFLALTLMVLQGGEAVRLDDPGLRIVWQLLQASIASCVLLAGLLLLFKQRGGNMLIHIGVGLLMVGQFVFGDRQIEQRVALAEGATTNLAIIEDELELALIDTSGSEDDVIYAIPESMIRKYAGKEDVIDEEALPCNVVVKRFMENSRLEDATEEDNLADAGIGLTKKAVELKPVGGAVMDSINFASVYVELISKESGKSLGTYLLNQENNDRGQLFSGMLPDIREEATIDGRSFELAIRYRQERKPYDVTLKDVQRINYSGTETPRDYSSVIVITDRATGESQEDKTWMNNPTRYRGETFYQSRYNKIPMGQGEFIETTGLQVVENAGWVIPYVCCMMVFWGMAAHFGGTFVRFAGKYERKNPIGVSSLTQNLGGRLAIAIGALAFVAVISVYYAMPKRYAAGAVDWNAVNTLPVQHEGRIKPFDTVARNILQRIGEPIFGFTPTIKDAEGDKREPSDWLLSVMAGEAWVRDVPVFRVYAKEAKTFMDLEPERKSHRYSYNELEENIEKLREVIAPLRGKDPDSFSFRDQKLVALHSKINLFDLISLSYMQPPLPSPEGVETEEQREMFFAQIMRTFEMMQNLESGGPPSMVPPMGEATEKNLIDAKWQAYGPARFKQVLGTLMAVEGQQDNEAVDSFASIVQAVNEEDEKAINAAVRKHSRLLAGMPLASVSLDRAKTESWLNKFKPTEQGVILYLMAILLGFTSFLVRVDWLRRATFWLLVGVFVIHTIAIISRIYVSGRAPVINLYSSAVFIGWACVMVGLVMEVLYPKGVANLCCGLIGVATISVARFLDTSDTMPVLQAVLDTQFWLSTHVVTVTAGYAVTFLAGFLGVCALVHR
ncbi:MAG: cytochrome c biogenesis protein ResB, partial [Planctomycetota bacterium]